MPQDPPKEGDDALRDKLTQLIAMGRHPIYTPEQLWAAQGRAQFPKPNIVRTPVMAGSPDSGKGMTLPMMQLGGRD